MTELEPAGPPRLSIVIVGWNCAAEIDGCLEAVAAHAPSGPLEIVYIDNASSDESVNRVTSRHPHVRVVRNRHNLGFQRACNIGLNETTGRTILLLNPDTRVLPGSLETLLRFLEGHPAAGAASPRCVYPDGRLQWSKALFPSLDVIWSWFCARHPRVARWLHASPVAIPVPDATVTETQDYAYGACFMVKREVVTAVGPMDETYFLAAGEVAWSREIRSRGWLIYYVAESTIVHLEGTSRARRPWISQVDWILGHRRLLYRYEGIVAGLKGDLIFGADILLGVRRYLLHR